MPSALPSRMHKFLIVSLILIFLLSAPGLPRATAADDRLQLSGGAPLAKPLTVYVKGKGNNCEACAAGLTAIVLIFILVLIETVKCAHTITVLSRVTLTPVR